MRIGTTIRMEVAHVLPAPTIIGSVIVLLDAPNTTIGIETIASYRGCWGIRGAQW